MLRTVMEYNELCRELKHLTQNNTPEPNPQLLQWATEASNQLAKLKGQLGYEDQDSSTDDEEEESPNAVQSLERLKELQKKKKGLLNELSEQAGMRLVNNNPGIANLGDDNRPSKIGEKFSELYDNFWTDAMETLDGNKFEEKESIEMLLQIAMITNEDCIQRRDRRLQLFLSLALCCKDNDSTNTDDTETIDIYQNVQVTSNGIHGTGMEGDQLRQQCSRYLSAKDSQLYQDKTVKEEIYGKLDKKFMDKQRNDMLKQKSIRLYIDKCLEVCWAICLQIPPVVVVSDKSNIDSYRSYTRSGEIIDYIVWPALLLHENGPLLYKGVAQMTSNEDSNQDMNLYENTQANKNSSDL